MMKLIALAEKCLASPILSIAEIHGGLLNETYKVVSKKGAFILKKHSEKPKLLAVGTIPGGRYEIEKKAYLSLEKIAPGLTPKLVCFDDGEEVLFFECLDETRRLDRIVDSVDASVFYEIGKAIANIANKTYGKKELLPQFDNTDFQELKYTYKYYETTKAFKELHKVRDEVMTITRTERTALVLGDIRLTNVFVMADGAFKFIDLEGAYFCEPSQDVAYFIGELVVRYLDKPTEALKKKILAIWRGYSEALRVGSAKTEYLVVKEIGFHLLDQLTGHISLDYAFVKDKNRLVGIAKDIILNRSRIEEIVGQ